MSETQVPFLSEHQAAGNSGGKAPGYNPSDEEKKLIRLVEDLYQKAKRHRRRYDSRWVDYYKMFRGRQWKETRPSYRSSEVLNLIFETIQSMVPILVDSKPRLEYLPTQPDQFELADILTKVAANDWDRFNWLMVLVECIYDAHFYGTMHGFIGHDAKADAGLGAIVFESQDNFHTFPDPNARDVNGRRTEHFLTAEPTDIKILKRDYPNVAQYLSSDVLDLGSADKADIYQTLFKSPVDSRLTVEGESSPDDDGRDQALKLTAYIKDEACEEHEEVEYDQAGNPVLDEATGEPRKTYTTRMLYPKGRRITVAGGVLCEDRREDIGFEDGLIPFAKGANYALPREYWGAGDIEPLESPQKTINKILACTLDCLSLMGNPVWVVDDSANIDTDNLFNKPGLVIEKAFGSEVRREPGVELPTYVLPLIGLYRTFISGLSGQSDLSKGVEPANVTAASAIASLQEAAQTRLRLKSKHIDAFLQEVGKLYLNRVFQFYSVPRIVRITGNDDAAKYFYFHVEKLGEKKFANVTYPDGRALQIEIKGDFDVRVATGTALPFAKAQKSDMAMKLFQLQVIDEEELLKSVDYPNYEQVLLRMAEKKAAMQKQQMEMQMAAAKAEVDKKSADASKSEAEALKTVQEVQTAAATPPILRGAGNAAPGNG